MAFSPDYLTLAEFNVLRPLSLELLPRSDAALDALVQAALAPLGPAGLASLDLELDHARRHVDFWDARKLATALSSCERWLGYGKDKDRPKLELSRSQVDEIKAFRKGLKSASREADAAYQRDVFKQPPPTVPTLSDSFYLTAAAERASLPQPLPPLDSFISRLFPSPSSRTLALERASTPIRHEYPQTRDVITTKYTMTRAQLDVVRQYRKRILKASNGSASDLKQTIESCREAIEQDAKTLHAELAKETSPSPEFFPLPSGTQSNAMRESVEPLEPIVGDDPVRSFAQVHEGIRSSGQGETAMVVGVADQPNATETSSTCGEPGVGVKTQSSTSNAAANSTHQAFADQHRAAEGEKRVGELSMSRLGPLAQELSTLETTRVDPLATLIPTSTSGACAALSRALDWNSSVRTKTSTQAVLLDPSSEETESRRRLRRDARDLRNRLHECVDPGVDTIRRLRDEIVSEAPYTSEDDGAEQEEEEPDPFEFFDRYRRTPTTPRLSGSRDALPHFPPPYTLYKRRATSLPPYPLALGSASGSRPASREAATGTPQGKDAAATGDATRELVRSSDVAFTVEYGEQDRVDQVVTEPHEVKMRESMDVDIVSRGERGEDEPPTMKTIEQNGTTEGEGRRESQPICRLPGKLGTPPPPRPSFRLFDSLDRFMTARGVESIKENSTVRASHRTAPSIVRMSTPVVEANAVTLPFPTPPFLGSSSTTSDCSSPSLRVITFDPLLQMRALSASLTRANFALVHRPSRFAPNRFVIQDPHLIISGTSCVLYFKLIDLIGNAVRDEPRVLSRPESILTTVRRISARYDHVLVVFEEQQASRKSASVRPYSYTPLVLKGLSRLADALEQLSQQTQGHEYGKIHVVCSTGPEYSAEVTRKFAQFIETEDAKYSPRSDVTGWGERTWLTDDPHLDESLLLEISPLLNEISACAILSTMTPSDFGKLAREEMLKAFVGRVSRAKHLTEIWSILHPNESEIPPLGSHLSTNLAPPAVVNLVSNDRSPLRSVDRPAGVARGLAFDDVFDFEKYKEQ